MIGKEQTHFVSLRIKALLSASGGKRVAQDANAVATAVREVTEETLGAGL